MASPVSLSRSLQLRNYLEHRGALHLRVRKALSRNPYSFNLPLYADQRSAYLFTGTAMLIPSNVENALNDFDDFALKI